MRGTRAAEHVLAVELSFEQPHPAVRRTHGNRPSLAETRTDIASEWDGPRNGSLTPWQVTPGSKKKVHWIGSVCGHPWLATVNNRTSGNGCAVCKGYQTVAGVNDLATTNPAAATELHPTRNDDRSAQDFTASSNQVVWWLCARGHEWQAPVYSRSSGKGCGVCSGARAEAGVSDLETLQPRLVLEWNWSKNTKSPSEFRVSSHAKVWWACSSKGHEWEAVISTRTNGAGCPFCVGKNPIVGETDLATLDPGLAADWDQARNGSMTPMDITQFSSRKVWWKCQPRGHVWKATVSSRSHGSGCEGCSGRRAVAGETDLETLRPDLAAEWDHRANTLLPHQVTLGSGKKVWWLCKKGHSWDAIVSSRVRGSGCSKCAGHGTSLSEKALYRALAPYLRRPINGARIPLVWANSAVAQVDVTGTFRGRKVAVEYDGIFYHSRAVSSVRDLAKTRALLDAGWAVVRVREGSLQPLDLDDHALFQLNHQYRQGNESQMDDFIRPAAAQIVDWLAKMSHRDRAQV
jgi:hypothetical protein